VAASAVVEAEAAVWSGWLDVVMSIISPVFAQARSQWAAFDYVQALLAAEGAMDTAPAECRNVGFRVCWAEEGEGHSPGEVVKCPG
jgi:hypothetical protein